MELWGAARSGKLSKVKELIDGGADIAEKGGILKGTPLYFAARGGHIDIVDYLIKNGADVNCKDNRGCTALHLACQGGHTAVVDCLLQHGADMESRDKAGCSPFHVACLFNNLSLVQCLISKGYDITATTEGGHSGLEIAEQGQGKDGDVAQYIRTKLRERDAEAEALFKQLAESDDNCSWDKVLEKCIRDGNRELAAYVRKKIRKIQETVFDAEAEALFKQLAESDDNCSWEKVLKKCIRDGNRELADYVRDKIRKIQETVNLEAQAKALAKKLAEFDDDCSWDKVLKKCIRDGNHELADFVSLKIEKIQETGNLEAQAEALFKQLAEFYDNCSWDKVLKKCIRDGNRELADFVRKKIGKIQETDYDEAYQRALQYGEEKSNRIPVMIIGQDRAGKTSLRKRLLGEPFDPEEPSTVGIHVDFIEVTDNTSSKPWKPRSQQRFFVNKPAAKDKLCKKAATMVRERPENLESIPEYKDLTEQRKDLTFIQNEDSMTNDALLPTQPASGYKPISNTSFPVQTLDHSVQPIDESLSPSSLLYQHSEIMNMSPVPIQPSKQQQQHQMIDITPSAGSTCNEQYSGTSDAGIQDSERISSPIQPPSSSNQQMSADLKRKTALGSKTAFKPTPSEKRKVMDFADLNEETKTPPVRMIVHDLAGQAIYYDTHYLFLKSHCPYILVHDLTKELDLPAQPRFKAKNIDVNLESANPLLATNLDYLLSWLTVLGQLREIESQNSAEFPDFVLPPVLIVLTNKDRFEGDIEEVKRRIKEVTDKFQNVFRNLEVIDNTTTSGSKDPIIGLRNKVFELCKIILEKEAPMPTRWLKFEAALREELFSKKKRNYIPVDEANAIAEKCNVDSFDDAIKFLNRQSMVVYYSGSPMVVLNPQWLMNLFTEVITVHTDDEAKPIDAPYLRELRDNGILMQEFLRKNEHGKLLEEVMQRVSLMCPLEHKGKSAFLVPSVAPFMKEGKPIDEKLNASPIASLFVNFLVELIPPGVFTRLQVKFIRKCREMLQKFCEEPRLFCNYTLLPLEFDNIKFEVYLIQLIDKIKIGVAAKRTSSPQSHAKFVARLKGLLEDCLIEIKSEEPLFYRGLRYEFLVKCTACSKVNEVPCRRHSKIHCSYNECSHMLPLEKIQQCPSESICCNFTQVEALEFHLNRVKFWCYDPKDSAIDESQRDNRNTDGAMSSGEEHVRRQEKRRPKPRDERSDEEHRSRKKRRRKQRDESSDEEHHKGHRQSRKERHRKQRDERSDEEHRRSRKKRRGKQRDERSDEEHRQRRKERHRKQRDERSDEEHHKEHRRSRKERSRKQHDERSDEEHRPSRMKGRPDQQTNIPASEQSINKLHLLTRQNICKKMDIKDQIGGDFRELAAYLNMRYDDLDLVAQEPNPTHKVLIWAARNPANTIKKLRAILVVMGRMDCVRFIDEDS